MRVFRKQRDFGTKFEHINSTIVGPTRTREFNLSRSRFTRRAVRARGTNACNRSKCKHNITIPNRIRPGAVCRFTILLLAARQCDVRARLVTLSRSRARTKRDNKYYFTPRRASTPKFANKTRQTRHRTLRIRIGRFTSVKQCDIR